MAISLVVAFEFDTRDLPTYVQQPSRVESLPAPKLLPESKDKTSSGKSPTDEMAEVAPGHPRALRPTPKK